MVQRLITASFMVVFGVLVLYFGGTVFAVGAMLCFIVALREEYHALSVAGHRPIAWPTWVAMIICIPMAAILKRPVFSPILMVTCLLTIALVIFTIWRPDVGIFASILFGGLYILYLYLPTTMEHMELKELYKMIPYVMTVVVLILTSMRNRRENQPPASLGLAYFREER